MNRKYTIGAICLLILFFCGLVRYRYRFTNTVDLVYRYSDSYFRNKDINKIDNLGYLTSDTTAWYSKYHVVAHGGGGIDGKTCTDSKESILLHYSQGTRLFDIDMNFTTDSVLVCRHSWIDNLDQNAQYRASDTRIFQWDIEQTRYILPVSDRLTYNEFKQTKAHAKYTPISVNEFLDIMIAQDDLIVLCDFGYPATTAYKHFYNTYEKQLPQQVRNRIVVTFNAFDELNELRQINPNVNLQLKRYGMKSESYYDVAKFCIDNGIHALNLSLFNIDDKTISILQKHGIHIFVAAVDYISDYRYCVKQGAHGIVSNFLYENDILTDGI